MYAEVWWVARDFFANAKSLCAGELFAIALDRHEQEVARKKKLKYKLKKLNQKLERKRAQRRKQPIDF